MAEKFNNRKVGFRHQIIPRKLDKLRKDARALPLINNGLEGDENIRSCRQTTSAKYYNKLKIGTYDMGNEATKLEELEKEMVIKLQERISPVKDKTWNKLKHKLKQHMDADRIKSLGDFTQAFKALKDGGIVQLGCYDKLIEILRSCDPQSANTAESYQTMIFEKLPDYVKRSKEERRNAEQVSQCATTTGKANREIICQGKRKASDADLGVAESSQPAKFRKNSDNTHKALLTDVRAKCNKSVGCIFSPEGSGTGFRVGSKYILTCWHIVKPIVTGRRSEFSAEPTLINYSRLTRDNVFIQFEYKREAQFDLNKRFKFVPNIPYFNPSLDVALLELKEDGKQLPPAIKRFGKPSSVDDIFFIGHPKGGPMREDPGIKIFEKNADAVKDIQNMNERWYRNWGTNEFLPLLDESKVIFDCYFQFGASGSPGMIAADDSQEPVVVIMLQGGVPKSYLELDPIQQAAHQIPNGFLKEYGLGIDTLYNDMKSNSENYLLVDIFKHHISQNF